MPDNTDPKVIDVIHGDLKKMVWDRFIMLLSIQTFGEKEVLAEKKLQKNLMGSVESHKAVFDKAFDSVLDEMAG